MSQEQKSQEKKIPDKLDVREVIDLTGRLSRLLAEEVDMLSAMKIARLHQLQEEKQFLINALDGHRRLLARHPPLSESIPSRDRKDLEAVVHVFETILQENHNRLLVAREVNRSIVQAVAKAVQEKAMGRIYDGSGTAGAMGNRSGLSLTLNQTA